MFLRKHQNESMARKDKEQHVFPSGEEVSEVPFNTVYGGSAFVTNLLSDGR